MLFRPTLRLVGFFPTSCSPHGLVLINVHRTRTLKHLWFNIISVYFMNRDHTHSPRFWCVDMYMQVNSQAYTAVTIKMTDQLGLTSFYKAHGPKHFKFKFALCSCMRIYTYYACLHEQGLH